MPQNKVYDLGQFLNELPEHLSEIVILLDDLFMSYPNVSMKIRFNIPFYDYGTWICYLNPVKKKKAIEVVFLKGKELQTVFHFLEDNGRKMVAGIRVNEVTDEAIGQIQMVWEEALTWQQA